MDINSEVENLPTWSELKGGLDQPKRLLHAAHVVQSCAPSLINLWLYPKVGFFNAGMSRRIYSDVEGLISASRDRCCLNAPMCPVEAVQV